MENERISTFAKASADMGDTGFTQFRHRWYDYTLGKWIGRDPIGVLIFIIGPTKISILRNIINNSSFSLQYVCPLPISIKKQVYR